MSLVEIDTGNPDLFKTFEFKVLMPGKHLFEVANDLIVEPAQSSENSVIKVEARCQDEDDGKGAVVWDNFTIIKDAKTEKEIKSKEINQGRLSQFAVACGVRTQQEIRDGKGIPLEGFKGKMFDAITKIEPYKDKNTQEDKTRTKIVRFLFEPETE